MFLKGDSFQGGEIFYCAIFEYPYPITLLDLQPCCQFRPIISWYYWIVFSGKSGSLTIHKNVLKIIHFGISLKIEPNDLYWYSGYDWTLLGSFYQQYVQEKSSRDGPEKVQKRPKNRVYSKAHIAGTRRGIENQIQFSESSVLSLLKTWSHREI